MFVVVQFDNFVLFRVHLFSFVGSNDPVLVEVVLVAVCRYTILQLSVEKDLQGSGLSQEEECFGTEEGL